MDTNRSMCTRGILDVESVRSFGSFLGDTMYKHNRGVIKESAVKAILQDPLFSQKVEKPKKGKGSYRRVKAVKVYL